MKTILIAAAICLACLSVSAQPISGARLAYLEGTVFANAVEAVMGQILPSGSRVRTGEASLAEIVFANRNILRMSPATILSLDPEAARVIDLKTGSLVLVLKKLESISGNESKLRVRTPSAIAGVRGTSFFMKVEDVHTTYVCCCNGRLHVEDSGRSEVRDIEASHHKAFTFSRRDGAVVVRDAGMQYHTDDMMQAAARRIGETIDWTRIESR